MRLLNVDSFELESYADARSAPPYAILSHTWGQGEVLFEDITKPTSSEWKEKAGYNKIQMSAALASQEGLGYVWIDTCCIDKSSSAELTEAINSMFRWYNSSNVCYAYLDDALDDSSIDDCRWFTRGWTLQELIAPQDLYFFDSKWRPLGSRHDLAGDLKRITRIDEKLLSREDGYFGRELFPRDDAFRTLEATLEGFNTATRMSWASQRMTTRVEDTAYCLMGLFNVNMPTLYGEGSKAFRRLQEQIVRQTSDASILAFEDVLYNDRSMTRILASHPSCFRHTLPSVRWGAPSLPKMLQMGNAEIKADVLLCPAVSDNGKKPRWLALFDCTFDGDFLSRPGILLASLPDRPNTYRRIGPNWLFAVRPGEFHSTPLLMQNKSESDIFDRNEGYGMTMQTSKAERKSITIVEEESVRTYRRGMYYVLAVEVTVSHEKGCPVYIEGASNTARSGNFRIHRGPEEQSRILYGIMKLTSGSNDEVFVTWGLSRRPSHGRATSEPAVCKLWTRQDLKMALSWDGIEQEETLTDERLIVMFSQHEPYGPAPRSTDEMTFYGESPHTIVVSIRETWFLERPYLDLNINVQQP